MRLIIEDIKHLKLKQDLLWVGTATLVTVLIWVSYSVYSAFNTTQIDPEIQALLTPINPNLDQETLNSLSNRFSPPEDFNIKALSPTPIPVATSSAR